MYYKFEKLGPGEYACCFSMPSSQAEKLKGKPMPEIKGVHLRNSKLTSEEAAKIIEDLKKG